MADPIIHGKVLKRTNNFIMLEGTGDKLVIPTKAVISEKTTPSGMSYFKVAKWWHQTKGCPWSIE